MADEDSQRSKGHKSRGGRMTRFTPQGAAGTVARVLQENNHEAYFVGGCVRDTLLHRRVSDYDVATSAHPDTIETLFPKTIPVGKAFGVIMVRHGEFITEVATFRKDVDYQDGRHPTSVEFSDAKEDARRRDFTVNALFMEPGSGKILDFVNGISDLSRRIIRTVGNPDERFQEDHLRTLRAVRFAARLQFSIEDKTAGAIRRTADQIKGVSVERVFAELDKMLTDEHAGDAIGPLVELGLMERVLPEVAELFRRNPEVVEGMNLLDSVISDFRWCRMWKSAVGFSLLMRHLGHLRYTETTPDPEDVAEWGARSAGEILERLATSKALRSAVTEVIRMQPLITGSSRFSLADRKRLVMRPYFEEAIEVYRISELTTGGTGLERYLNLRDLGRTLRHDPPDFSSIFSGEDLIEMGLNPGPNFKGILHEMESAYLGGVVTTRDELIALAKHRFQKK